METVPRLGGTSPFSAPIRVDLPTPERPTITVMVPWTNDKRHVAQHVPACPVPMLRGRGLRQRAPTETMRQRHGSREGVSGSSSSRHGAGTVPAATGTIGPSTPTRNSTLKVHYRVVRTSCRTFPAGESLCCSRLSSHACQLFVPERAPQRGADRTRIRSRPDGFRSAHQLSPAPSPPSSPQPGRHREQGRPVIWITPSTPPIVFNSFASRSAIDS